MTPAYLYVVSYLSLFDPDDIVKFCLIIHIQLLLMIFQVRIKKAHLYIFLKSEF